MKPLMKSGFVKKSKPKNTFKIPKKLTMLEAIASKFEVTCDYVIEEFMIDYELKEPEMFFINIDGEFIVVDFTENTSY